MLLLSTLLISIALNYLTLSFSLRVVQRNLPRGEPDSLNLKEKGFSYHTFVQFKVRTENYCWSKNLFGSFFLFHFLGGIGLLILPKTKTFE